MAYDKVIDSAQLDADLTSVADAIRAKGGTTEQMSFPDGFVNAVEGISAGGGDDTINALLDGSISGVYENADITRVQQYGFAYRSNLTKISLPNVVNVGGFCFRNCSALEEVVMGNLLSGSQQMFNLCKKLTRCCFPKMTSAVYQFLYLSSVAMLDVPSMTNIAAQSLNPAGLKSVILHHSSVVTLANTNAFNQTSVTNGTVKIYVPSSLVESYQTATNWASLYAQNNDFIQPIEGSEYE